jgi:hypothetical protein
MISSGLKSISQTSYNDIIITNENDTIHCKITIIKDSLIYCIIPDGVNDSYFKIYYKSNIKTYHEFQAITDLKSKQKDTDRSESNNNSNESVIKGTNENFNSGRTEYTIIQEKNPALAFILSMFIPGTGQMYNGQIDLGIGIFIGDAVLNSVGSILFSYGNNTGTSDYYRNTSKYKTAFALGIACYAIGGCLHLIQMIQAPIYTKKRNISKGFSAGNSNYRLNVAYIPSNNSLGLILNF